MAVDNRQLLIDLVIDRIKMDINDGDVTSIEAMLHDVPDSVLQAYLPED